MTPLRWLQGSVLVIALALCALPAAADSVQLVNGDVLSGKVLSLDDKQLRLESDTLGQVYIPRVKIASITLGDKKPAAAPVAAPKAATAPGGLTPEAILKQLQTTGVNARDLNDIQKMFPLLATPQASSYFNDTIKGLMGGTKSIGDIRKEAVRARDELKKATKGLGADVDAAVAPYLTILEKFINETEPRTPPKTGKTAPPAKK